MYFGTKPSKSKGFQDFVVVLSWCSRIVPLVASAILGYHNGVVLVGSNVDQEGSNPAVVYLAYLGSLEPIWLS